MPCPSCNAPDYVTCDCEVSIPYCNPCTTDSKCVQKVDAECVIYHRDDDKPTKLTCMSIANKTTLESILETIDGYICNISDVRTPLTVIDTPSIDLTAFGTLKHTLQADVKVSEDIGNAVEIRDDGLFVDITGGGGVYTANNGLTQTPANNFKLGGLLTANTAVNLSNFRLSLLDSPTNTGIVLTPTDGLVDVHGDLVADQTAWIKNNTTIGSGNANTTFGTLAASPKLTVGKIGVISGGWPAETSAYINLTVNAPSSVGSVGRVCATFSNISWSFTANQTISPNTAYSAAVSNFQYLSQFRTTGGNLSSHSAQVYFFGVGSVDRIIGYRATSPSPAVEGFTGVVDEAVGIMIEGQQRLLTTQVTASYGIKQLGVEDRNQFNGAFQLPSTNNSIGTATLVAGSVTVSTTAAKAGSHIFISRNNANGTLGHLSASNSSIIDGVSFVIQSSSGTETSTINWWIINN